MPALRQRLKRPETYLFALLLIAVLFVFDSTRAAEKQLTARGYIAAVRVYQKIGRPILAGRVVCRYQPTCSDYSIEAVRRYGILRGVRLTIARINSCNRSVPSGTSDPVPAV